ncbi:MAG TPA: FHA domain-containing protein [Herpetosiphonaceae bacterium]
MRELTLQWYADGRPAAYVVTEHRPIVLGRREDCDVVLSARTVSRQHATIFAYQGYFYLRNLSQQNVIYVNGQQLFGDHLLRPGDVFVLSDVPLQVAQIYEVQPAVAPQMMIRCVSCQNVADIHARDCPWCGASLAHGVTVYM